MAIKVLELHHQGVRVGGTQEEADRTAGFYHDVLGLNPDKGRPNIPGIPGYWIDVGGRAQIHLMGVEGASYYPKGPGMDPSLPHIAFAVQDLEETRAESERIDSKHWVAEGIIRLQSQQVFMHDPSDNMIELHLAGTCRCQAVTQVGG